MAVVTLTDAQNTREITLATTTGRIEVGAALADRIAGYWLRSTSAFRTLVRSSPAADASAAPTTDYRSRPADVDCFIAISPGRAHVLEIWATSGTPRVEIEPVVEP